MVLFFLFPLIALFSGHVWMAAAGKNYWRLRVVTINTNNYSPTIWELDLYDASNAEITGGTWSSNKGNTNINYINDNNGLTAYTFPPTGSAAGLAGSYLQYVCPSDCDVKRVKMSQAATIPFLAPNNVRIWSMILESSIDSGATWVAESPTFGTDSQYTDYSPPTQPPSLVPTRSPTRMPTAPSVQPTFGPTVSPTMNPTPTPTANPTTALPSAKPTFAPTFLPTTAPPTQAPTLDPTKSPTLDPTRNPTTKPTFNPSANPSVAPSAGPTLDPTVNPTKSPTLKPTLIPTTNPSVVPSAVPSCDPSTAPSVGPTVNPTRAPTLKPTANPSFDPSVNPSAASSAAPSVNPSVNPSAAPSAAPSVNPSVNPSASPSAAPSVNPSVNPSAYPSAASSAAPSVNPSVNPSASPSAAPSVNPSVNPSAYPSAASSAAPSVNPSVNPSESPSVGPSEGPSAGPSASPTVVSSVGLTVTPTAAPTSAESSVNPSFVSTNGPTVVPMVDPLVSPSVYPSETPFEDPTNAPMAEPSKGPITGPTITPTTDPVAGTSAPAADSTTVPSVAPTDAPSTAQSAGSTAGPSVAPSLDPTAGPSEVASAGVTAVPTVGPSVENHATPSVGPTTTPTVDVDISAQPTAGTSAVTSVHPTAIPTVGTSAGTSATPTVDVSGIPTADSTFEPSVSPTAAATVGLSTSPSAGSTATPISKPSAGPTIVPTVPPSVDVTASPLNVPTLSPSVVPVVSPSKAPASFSSQPSMRPAATLSDHPSATVTATPTALPSALPALGISYLSALTDSVAPKTKVNAVVALTAGSNGIVYCGAFPWTDITLPTSVSVSDVLSQQFSALSANSVAHLALLGLIPATNYRIYCATESFDGTLMSTQQMLEHSWEVTTGCCRAVKVVLSTPNLEQGKAAVNSILVTLDALSATSLTVKLLASVAVATGTGTTTLPVFYPNTVVFSSTSVSTSVYVTVVAGSAGEFGVNVERSGTNAADYQEIFGSSGNKITVRGNNEAPPVPSLTSAAFVSDGSTVEVTFSAATNMAGYSTSFPCAELFSFVGDKSASCVFTDASTVVIYLNNALPADQQLVVFDEATSSTTLSSTRASEISLVIDNKLKAMCSSELSVSVCSVWSSAPASTVRVRAPAVQALPVVSLSIPPTLSAVTPLTIDLTASTGSGGRAWGKPTFTVASSSGADVSDLTAFLSGSFAPTVPISVPNALFTQSGTYTITATLCNFLGACNTARRSVTVDKSATSAVTVTISGQQQRTVLASQSVVLTSSAYSTDSAGVTSTTGLSYSWAVSENGVLRPSLISESRDTSVFRLSGHRLTASRLYDVTLTVRNAATGMSSAASVRLTVQPSGVVAQVAGGSVQAVVVGKSLTLDASSSYDGDAASPTGTAAGLIFSWSCVQLTPVYSPSCPLDFTDDGSVIIAPASEKLTLFALARAVNTTSLVTVTVVDASNTRTSTASVTVHTQYSAVSVVSITTTAQKVTKVNTQDTLSLFGSVAAQSSCTAVWSVDTSAVSLPDSRTVIPSGRTRSVSLVLSAYTLPVRSSLLFTLTCGASSSQIAVTTNGPPQPGTFTVSPWIGVELSDMFQFAAALWTDADLPISYQFSFETPSTGETEVVQIRSEAAFASSTLPAGAPRASNALTCVVRVFDRLDATVTSSMVITVTPLLSAQRPTAMHAMLAASVDNNAAARNAISISGAVLNTVSCDRAPACAALNRAGCAKVRNTCGACLNGYVGEVGDANSRCVSDTTTDSTALASVGTSCTSSANCQGWAVCDTTLAPPVCVLPAKACPQDCSQQGSCVFQNVFTLQTLLTCKVSDPSCTAVCQCADSFSGADCNVSMVYQQQQRDLRTTLLTSLVALAASSDVSKENLLFTSHSLSAIAQNSYELVVDSVNAVNAVAVSVLTNAANLGSVSYGSADGVLSAVDASVSAATRADNRTAVSDALLHSVAAFSDLMSSQLVAGQEGVDYVQDSFRLRSVRRNVDSRALVVSTPQTSLERLANAPASTVSIESDVGNSEEEEFAVSVITTAASAYGELGATFLTNPLQVRVSRSSAAATTVKFSLVHHVPMEFTDISTAAGMNFTSTCLGASDTAIYYHTCPLSYEVLEHNCTGLMGVMTSYCSVRAPSCSVLNTAANTADFNSTLCEVSGYDAYMTNCTCKIQPTLSVPARRRCLSNQLEQSGLLDVVSSNVYLANQFVNTFNSADDLTSVAALKRVLIVIIMFSTLWAGGFLLIFGCAWRRKVMLKVNERAAVKFEKNVQKAYIARSPNEVRRYLTNYVTETFPAVFSNKPFFSRLYHEIKRHHRYLMLFTAPEGEAGDKLRIVVGAQLLSVQTMLMFSLALLYDVQGPSDDGTCGTHLTEQACLSRKSPFDRSLAYCDWTQRSANTADFYCRYREPVFSIQVVIYIAVIVAILTAAISYPIDRIFEMLSAPVADDTKLAAQESAVAQIGRRVSNVARRASNAAVSVASAARTKLNATRQSIVGTVTRKIPASTEAAHALATASVSLIADNFHRSMQERQLSRLREFHNLGGMPTTHRDYSDSESSVSSDASEDESDVTDHEEEGKTEETRPVADVNMVNASSTARAAHTQSAMDALIAKLSLEVTYQRRQLKTSELEWFDEQWGVDPTGEFTLGDRSLLPCFDGTPGAQQLIRKELEFVESETTKRSEKLNMATDAHTGLEILHLFIKDLLGRNTPAAQIFETKSAEDFEHTRVVSRFTKRLAVVALVALNSFFVYYALLTGFRRGVGWQQMFLIACLIQMIVEVTLFETMECVWINCCVPILVRNEVRAVGDSIAAIVEDLCAGTSLETAKYLNAPDYLFVSTNVAKKFPHLMESILVQAYHSHVPGELAKTWQVGSIARLQRLRHQNLRNVTLLTTLLTTLQFMGTAPFIFHRMFVRFVQPFVFTGIVLFWNFIIHDPLYIGVTCAVTALAASFAAYRYYRTLAEERVQVHELTPIKVEYEENAISLPVVNEGGFLNYPAPVHRPQSAHLDNGSSAQDSSKGRSIRSRSDSSSSTEDSEPRAARYAAQTVRTKHPQCAAAVTKRAAAVTSVPYLASSVSNSETLTTVVGPPILPSQRDSVSVISFAGGGGNGDVRGGRSSIDSADSFSVTSAQNLHQETSYQLNREALYADSESEHSFSSASESSGSES